MGLGGGDVMNIAVTGDDLVVVRDVGKTFSEAGGLVFGRSQPSVRAVDGASFEVKRGETLALVGNPAAENPPSGGFCCG